MIPGRGSQVTVLIINILVDRLRIVVLRPQGSFGGCVGNHYLTLSARERVQVGNLEAQKKVLSGVGPKTSGSSSSSKLPN